MTSGHKRFPSLIVVQGPVPNQVFQVNKPSITIGRHSENDIHIEDKEISRLHARLRRTGNDWMIEDIKSRNGVWVNNRQITSPTILQDGDTISLGSNFRFQIIFPKEKGTKQEQK
jgi:pSer/pThr/pTyr-binding forkhead associated (FHA) protein